MQVMRLHLTRPHSQGDDSAENLHHHQLALYTTEHNHHYLKKQYNQCFYLFVVSVHVDANKRIFT